MSASALLLRGSAGEEVGVGVWVLKGAGVVMVVVVGGEGQDEGERGRRVGEGGWEGKS